MPVFLMEPECAPSYTRSQFMEQLQLFDYFANKLFLSSTSAMTLIEICYTTYCVNSLNQSTTF